jgi:hypothetical protein
MTEKSNSLSLEDFIFETNRLNELKITNKRNNMHQTLDNKEAVMILLLQRLIKLGEQK